MLPARDRIPGARKIAVLRANALGDLLFAMPALEALRAAYPDAEIVFLGRAWHRDFLVARPGLVDRVEVVPAYPGITVEEGDAKDEEGAERFLERMRDEHFDIALQMHGGGRNSNPFVLALGAGMTAGSRTPDAPLLDRWIPYIYFQHEVLRLVEVAALVGAVPSVLEPHVDLIPAEIAEAEAVLPPGGRPLAALHPGVSSVDRQWPPDRFAAVGDALAATGARVVVTGSEGERELVRQVVGMMRHEAVDLVGRLSIGGLAALYARCAVVVSNDTGPRHLAEAVGAPTVGIFWCFNMINGGPMWRTKHRPLVSWQLNCSICGRSQVERNRCDHKVSYVDGVATEAVTEQALDLLQTYAYPGAG